MVVEVMSGALSCHWGCCCWRLRHSFHQGWRLIWDNKIIIIRVKRLELTDCCWMIEVTNRQEIRMLMKCPGRVLIEKVFWEKLWMLLPHNGRRKLALVNCAGIARSKFVESIDHYRLIDSIYRLSKHLWVRCDLYAPRVSPLLLLIEWRFNLELAHDDLRVREVKRPCLHGFKNYKF